MHIDVLTLFPEMVDTIFETSILKRAYDNNHYSYSLVNFRDYTENKHHKVDDYPYGGGAGMVLTPQPLFDATKAVTDNHTKKPRIILMCPQGEVFQQKKAEELAEEDHLVFICGHYEGYDERIREALATDEISIGDYVMTGGELGAMVVIDSVLRLLPDVLGNEESPEDDSFSTGILEHPHYTRPANYKGYAVPEVLTSGNHEKIRKWRREKALERTYHRRPDLLEDAPLTDEDRKMLEDIKKNKHR